MQYLLHYINSIPYFIYTVIALSKCTTCIEIAKFTSPKFEDNKKKNHRFFPFAHCNRNGIVLGEVVLHK